MTTYQRSGNRAADQLRPVRITRRYTIHAEGSVLIEFGDTACCAPRRWKKKCRPHKRGSGEGWVTAEYGMLPRATHTRGDREAARGKQSGRTQEIQRLIGRSCAPCSTSRSWASAPSTWTATCCRPTAARAPPPSPAPLWRRRTRSTSCWPRAS
jgi:ribonuclease PH